MNGDSTVKPHGVKRVLLMCGVIIGLSMAVVPFVASTIGIARASRVPGGLRGATHVPAMQNRVGFALGSASLTAILAPPGLLLTVLSALALASGRRSDVRKARRIERDGDVH